MTTKTDENYPNFEEEIPIVGCGCCFTSCVNQSPDCLFCSYRSNTCGLKSANICCRHNKADGAEEEWICNANECVCVPFSFELRNYAHTCCSDSRCAFPSDEHDAPLLFNLCCITCYFYDHFTFKCCKKVKDLRGSD